MNNPRQTKTTIRNDGKKNNDRKPVNRTKAQNKGGNQKAKSFNPLIVSHKQQLAYRIPECVSHYMAALTNPFETPAGACLPCDLFPMPSNKLKVFVRGAMALGPSGLGFIAATPVFSNNASMIQHTTATSVGSPTAAFNTFTNLADVNCSQNQYPSADFTGGDVSGRVVAFGLRVKYVGKLMDRNGMIQTYEDPEGTTDCRKKSWTTLGSDPYSRLVRVGDSHWDGSICHSGPSFPTLLEFNPPNGTVSIYPFGSAAPIVLAIFGIAGDNYEYEYYQHYELIGTKVPGKTPSHAEAQMFGKVVETVKNQAQNGPITPFEGPSLWERFKDSLAEAVPQIVSAGAGIARVLAGDYVGGGLQAASAVTRSLTHTPSNAPQLTYPGYPGHQH